MQPRPNCHVAINIGDRDTMQPLLTATVSKPAEKPISFGAAAGSSVQREPAEIAHPFFVLTTQIALELLERGCRLWNGWPLSMHQP